MNNTWIDKYWSLMVQENFEEAIPLKADHFPDSFFKYRSLSDRTIEIIEENYMWLSEISSLNDPFECSIQFDNDECLRLYYSSDQFKTNFNRKTGHTFTKEEIRRLTKSNKPFEEYIKICKERDIPFKQTPEEQLNKVQSRWTEIVNETNQNLRICSFSLINDSLLLWSHYANEHKGICIEYDFQEVDWVRTFIQPVNYKDVVHKIGIFEDYTTMQMIGSSLIKSSDWKYEQEWRVTSFRQKDEFPKKVDTPTPKTIYLGTRFYSNPRKLINRLFTIAEQRKIPIFQMQKYPNEYKLIKAHSPTITKKTWGDTN